MDNKKQQIKELKALLHNAYHLSSTTRNTIDHDEVSDISARAVVEDGWFKPEANPDLEKQITDTIEKFLKDFDNEAHEYPITFLAKKLLSLVQYQPQKELTLKIENPFDCSVCESDDCSDCGESAYNQGKVDQLAHDKETRGN